MLPTRVDRRRLVRRSIELTFAIAGILVTRLALAQPFATPPPPPYFPAPPPPPYREPLVIAPASAPPPPTFEIAPLGGIQFLGSADTAGGELDVGFSSVWGAALALHVAGVMPELSYTFQPTSLSFEPAFGSSQKLFSMSVHHILAGVAVEVPVSKYVQPFVGVSLGMAIFAPHGGQISDEVRFASAIYGGSEFVITPNVGIRLQARVVSTFFDTGSTVFCGAFVGCSFGLLSSGLTQLGFMVGPTFRF